MRGYFPLIQKDYIIHMHGLAVYMKEGLPLVQDVSLENFPDSYLCFGLALIQSVSYFFFLCLSPSSLLCMVFYSVLLANVSVFGDFNLHHKDWLTFSGGTDRRVITICSTIAFPPLGNSDQGHSKSSGRDT